MHEHTARFRSARTSGGHDADVLVVGSGFGGAVAAARLAQAGYRVLVLERGRRWNPGDFPRAPHLRDKWLWRVDRGLYDIRWLEGMIAVQAAGWGGGSLAYANVFARPFDAALSRRWPPHLRRTALDPFYDLAAHMLEVSPTDVDPRTGRVPERTRLIEQLMEPSDRRRATTRPNLAVTFGDPHTWRANRHGVPRRGCAFVGECVIGCNHGAKNTLDVTYLAVAEGHGARAVTGAEVIGIRPEHGGYAVTARTLDDDAAATRTWRAPRVVLAAGSVATTELLLRARDLHRTLPRLSHRLGEGFSGNGDFLTLAELRRPAGDLTTGPTITTSTVLDVPEGRRTVWYQVQDGAFPAVLHELFDAVVPGQRVRTWWRRHFSEPDLRRTFAVLSMGHDSGSGRLRLDPDGDVELAWRNRWQSALYRSQRRLGPMLARLLGAKLYHPLTWSVLHRTTTVHPIGGVPSGPDGTSGVVDELGEVHGYPGLFVMDGSTLPASTGVNPSATILAAAERSVQTLIRRDGQAAWRAPEWDDVTPTAAPEDEAFAFAADLRASTRGGGMLFAERMRTARTAPASMDLRLTVETRSLDALLEDPDHRLSVRGTVDVAGVARAAAVTGTLSLLPEHGRDAMRYDLRFRDDARQPWTLTGRKEATGAAPWRVLRDLTHLSAVARREDEHSDPLRGTLRIDTTEQVRLLRSLQGVGFTRARRIRTVLRFTAFFGRGVWRLMSSGGRRRAPCRG